MLLLLVVVLRGGKGCLRFGIKCPLGTFFKVFTVDDLGVLGASFVALGELGASPPSVLLRVRNDGERISTSDGRLLRVCLSPRSGAGIGEWSGESVSFSINRGLFGKEPTGDFSRLVAIGLLDTASDILSKEEDTLREAASVPRWERLMSSLSWSTITVDRF